jgi:NAD(P)-dependent dehydrogenase (short-subunit alcohol dehydrogenase family)
MRLSGRTMVITGAAGGIGSAIARRCHSEGARVAVTDRDEAPLRKLGEELGDGHLALPADITDETQLGGLLARVETELGPVDVFCANAGVAVGGDPVQTPHAVWEQAFAVNVRAHILAARLLLPGWLQRGEGYFVAVASAAGLLTQIGSAPYSVSKHAAVAFAEWLSVTYGDRGLHVSCICPMGVRTAMEGKGPGALEDLSATRCAARARCSSRTTSLRWYARRSRRSAFSGHRIPRCLRSSSEKPQTTTDGWPVCDAYNAPHKRRLGTHRLQPSPAGLARRQPDGRHDADGFRCLT